VRGDGRGFDLAKDLPPEVRDRLFDVLADIKSIGIQASGGGNTALVVPAIADSSIAVGLEVNAIPAGQVSLTPNKEDQPLPRCRHNARGYRG